MISFQRNPDCERPNRGFTVHEVKAIKDGECIGHIKAELIPLDRFNEYYKSIDYYLYHIKGIMSEHYFERLQKYRKEEMLNEFKDFKEYHVDFPFVSFVRVKEEYRRQGIGRSLYIECGKYMKEMGLQLHSSTLQCNEVPLRVWESLKRDGLAADLPKRAVDKSNRLYIL